MWTKIKVTKADIDKGVRCKSRLCPIARAVRKIVKRDVMVEVTGRWISLGTDPRDNDAYVPKSAGTFIANFDDGKKVKPFCFSANIPQKFLREAKS